MFPSESKTTAPFVAGRESSREGAKRSYHPKGWPGRDDNFKVVPVQRVAKSQTDTVYVEGLWGKITEQLKLASEGDSYDNQQTAFDQLARDFETLKNHCLTNEETLHDIKARNMYNMVDQVSLGKSGSVSNLMFLTNKQADMLSKSSTHVDKIIAAFQVKEPKLVINLLHDANGVFDNGLDEYAPRDVVPYATAWGCAFETKQKAKEAFFRLVRFMKEVVVPLAEETNALILCSASESVLTRALLEATDAHSKVTIIGFANQLKNWMQSEGEDTKRAGKNMIWRDACQQSQSWRAHQKIIDEAWSETLEQDPVEHCFYREDLLPGLHNLIIIDTYDQHEKTCQKEPFYKFYENFVKTLFSRYGFITFKTGRMDEGKATIADCLDVLKANSPVFLLDCFERSAATDWKEAKSNHEKNPRVMWLSEDRFQAVWGSTENRQHCPAILADLCNNFDLAINPDDSRPFMIPTEDLPVDFLAYAHQLFRQNMAKIEATQRYETLHQAIQRMQSARDKAARDQLTQYAKTRQVHLRKMKRFIRWYLESFDGWGTYRWGGKIMGTDARLEYLKAGLLVQAEALLAHPKLFGINVKNIKDAKKLVRNSSPLARLPQASLEGLKLLRDCWDEFDVTMHLSNLYKIATQISHFILLLGAVVIIILVAIESRSVVIETVLEHNSTATDIWEGKYLWPTFWFEGTAQALRHTTFALTLWTTFAYGTITLINPRARWQHLRIHARALESIIWAYRTRTGVFGSDPQAQANADEESRGSLPLPEDRALTAALVAWRERVIHSGDLGLTLLHKAYEKLGGVFMHGQYSSSTVSFKRDRDNAIFDDHFSPASPKVYMSFRMGDKIAYYQSQIPRFQLYQNVLRILVLLLCMASAVFSFIDHGLYVAMITTIAAAFDSWNEFLDIDTKIRRYTNAIENLKNQQNYWNSLGDIDRTDQKIYSSLVEMCEAGIRQEVRSWFAAFDAKKIQREVYKIDGRQLDVQPTANDGVMQ